jgi:tetratricopeptide (TPR) repeat protein
MRKLLLSLVFLLALAACETSEERAEKHFVSAQELVAEGDIPRALVELRNVFKLNNRHREARRLYAQMQVETGHPDVAYKQYLRLVEQYPDDIEALRALSEMSLRQYNWEAAERYVPRGYALLPDDLSFQSMDALLKYRDARQDQDTDTLAQIVQTAQDILVKDDTQLIARQILIDSLLSEQNLTGALDEIETSLEQDPEDLRLHEAKLRVLNGLQDSEAVGRHLESMISKFPDNEQIRSLLINSYLREGKLDEAETFLRKLADEAPEEDRKSASFTVIRFLQQTKGADAALAEMEARIAAGVDVPFYRSLRAAHLYDNGRPDEAISELQDLIKNSDPSEDVRNSKVVLAQILEGRNDNVGARALVEEVLAEDPLHVRALQMKANWYIADDRPGEAIQLLREALDKEPTNANTLTLMAQAHLRDGNRELAGERLSVAVEVSGNAPTESVRYANFLLQDNRFAPAEVVLLDALRRDGDNIQVLQTLGLAYMSQADWGRTTGVIQQLERIDTEQSRNVASSLRANMLLRQNKTEESIEFLQGMIDEDNASSLEAAALIIQTHLREGNLAEAQEFLNGMIADDPENTALLYIQAALLAAGGDLEKGEAAYRDLIVRDPQNDTPVLALFTLLRQSGKAVAARTLLDEALDRIDPPSARLQATKAALLEAEGDFEGAITIYEALYAQNTSNIVLANNLASLITSHRDDAESLERAFSVARRLRGSDVPAMRDTYGWIQYRRGNFQEAVEYLEPAAAGLPNDPLVQAHLGLAYAAAEQVEQARETLTRALTMAGDSTQPTFVTARDTLENLPEDTPESDEN